MIRIRKKDNIFDIELITLDNNKQNGIVIWKSQEIYYRYNYVVFAIKIKPF